jgi:hypothetical protein
MGEGRRAPRMEPRTLMGRHVMNRCLASGLMVVVTLFWGCATPRPPRDLPISGNTGQCREYLSRLDARVDEAGVRDASVSRVSGFPYLRSNRFLAALREDLRTEAQGKEWARWMRDLDRQARAKEIANLPQWAIEGLSSRGGVVQERVVLGALAARCADDLLRDEGSEVEFHVSATDSTRVPDEYSWLLQAVGLYPLAAIPVALATAGVGERIRAMFQLPPDDLPVDGRLGWFVPPHGPYSDPQEIRSILDLSSRNSLGVPLPDPEQSRRLARAFAPIWMQVVANDRDRIGKVHWLHGRLEIDIGRPSVYYYLTHTYWKGKPLLQINYVVWYAERGGGTTPWMERGHLDGLTIRVTLEEGGAILALDGMHNCGCFHFFVPKSRELREAPSALFGFAPLVPQWLPELPQGARLAVRVSASRHLVQRVLASVISPEAVPYELVPYDELEALPTEHGASESMFDGHGIAKGSERVEQFILFPMGIPRIGAMRQRGHHAIAFTGRVHFDDPDLFERSFFDAP